MPQRITDQRMAGCRGKLLELLEGCCVRSLAAAACKLQGSPKPPEARLSTTWHALFIGLASLQLAGRLPVPTRYNVRDARAAHLILSAHSVSGPAMPDPPLDLFLCGPLPHLEDRAASFLAPFCKSASYFVQHRFFVCQRMPRKCASRNHEHHRRLIAEAPHLCTSMGSGANGRLLKPRNLVPSHIRR